MLAIDQAGRQKLCVGHLRSTQCCCACLKDLHGCRTILTALWGVGQGALLADEEEQEKSGGGCQAWLTGPTITSPVALTYALTHSPVDRSIMQ